MSTNQHPTTPVALPTLRQRPRVLAGLGIAAALTVATITGAGVAAAGDKPADQGPSGQRIVKDTSGHDGLVWVPEAGSWLVEDTSNQIAVDAAGPIAEDPAAEPGQDLNEQTGLVWNDQAGTWMFADTGAETGTL